MREDEYHAALALAMAGDVEGFRFEKLDTARSRYYTGAEQFELVVMCSHRYQREGERPSPWLSGFAREAPRARLRLVPRAGAFGRVSAQHAMRKASEGFEGLRAVSGKSEHRAHTASSSVFGLVRKADSAQVVQTPAWFLAELRRAYPFDFDPAPVHPAQDAMGIDWGQLNYVNPPFRYTHGFLAKAVEQAKQRGCRSVFLIPEPFQCTWFSDLLMEGCFRRVIFLRSGIRFDGYDRPCPLPLLLLEVGPPLEVHPERGVELPLHFWDPCQKRRKIPSDRRKTLLEMR